MKWIALVLMVCAAPALADGPALDGRQVEWAIIPDDDWQSRQPEPTVCMLQARLSTPRCIDVDEFGRIYVLDHSRQTLMLLSASGNLQAQWTDGYDDAYQPMGSRDISYTPGQGVFLTPNGYTMLGVRRFRADEKEPAVIPVVEAKFGPCLAAAADGSIYIHNAGSGRRTRGIDVYSPDGKFVREFATPELESMTTGPDGLIYCAARRSFEILVYTPEGELVRRFELVEVLGKDAGGILGSIAVDENGDIYLVCRYNWIVRLGSDGRFRNAWHGRGSADAKAISVSFDDISVRNGLIYTLSCLERMHPQLQVFTPDGQCIARYVWTRPDIELPGRLAIHPDGSYAVLQYGLGNALVFSPSGARSGEIEVAPRIIGLSTAPNGGYYEAYGYGLSRCGATGCREESLSYLVPNSITGEGMVQEVASNVATGDAWAVCPTNHVRVFAPDGKLRRQYANVRLPGPHFGPPSIAVDPTGFYYLGDRFGNRVLKFDFAGNQVAAIGSEGDEAARLKWPRGMSVGKDGSLLVADSGNSRIQAFDKAGKWLGYWAGEGTSYGPLDRPLDVAFGPHDTVWIADTFHDRIVRLPLREFHVQLKKEVALVVAAKRPAHEPEPAQGSVVVKGIVTAGNDELEGLVYVEGQSRAWAVAVKPPAGVALTRGDCVTVSGTYDVRERLLAAVAVQKHERLVPPEPLGMANLYVGDGFAPNGRAARASNRCLLVRTWGRVVSMDPQKRCFIINDGSLTTGGLLVGADKAVSKIITWPRVGQYVSVTGISVRDTRGAGVLIRRESDLYLYSGD